MAQQKQAKEFRLLRVGAPQIRLLERLCNACAVSGDEGEVRQIVLEQVRGHLKASGREGEVSIDALGNVLVKLPGKAQGNGRPLKVMLAAHMDEVGFMITNEEDKGIFRFANVGGIDVRQLAGKPVLVGAKKVPAVIGAKPIHLTKDEELKSAITLETLRIDSGLESKGIKPGDRATFATQFTRLGPSVRAKALDNRFGVATLIELVKNAPENIDLLAAFTVQEEVGLRGARVAAYGLDPDLAFALDSTPAYDLPHWDEEEGRLRENTVYNTRLGAGPAIYLADAGTLSDPRLIRHLADTGDALQIPYQFRQPGGGGTDAGAIHKVRAGIPSVSISVPSRYPHSPASIGLIADWQNTLGLVQAALVRLPADILQAER